MNQHIHSPQSHNQRRRFFLVGMLLIIVIITFLGLNSVRIFTTQEFTVLQSMPEPVVGIVVNAQRVVVTVEPGGAAAKAGVQVGDVLVAIGDTSVVSLMDAAAAMQGLRGVRGAATQPERLGDNPQEQAIRDATAVALLLEESRPTIDQVILTFRRGPNEIRKRIQLQPRIVNPSQLTPTPISQNMLYL